MFLAFSIVFRPPMPTSWRSFSREDGIKANNLKGVRGTCWNQQLVPRLTIRQKKETQKLIFQHQSSSGIFFRCWFHWSCFLGDFFRTPFWCWCFVLLDILSTPPNFIPLLLRSSWGWNWCSATQRQQPGEGVLACRKSGAGKPMCIGNGYANMYTSWVSKNLHEDGARHCTSTSVYS